MQKLGLKFVSATVEAEYKDCTVAHIRSIFKILLGLTMLLMAIMTVLSVIRHRIQDAIISGVSVFVSLVCFKFINRLQRVISYLLVILCLGICSYGYFAISIQFPRENFNPFLIGTSFGAFENIVSKRLPRLSQKIVFNTLILLSKLFLLPDPKVATIIAQCVILVIMYGVDISEERQERKKFKSFYEYREELTKFKNLLVSGLPANVLVLDREIQKELFANESVQNTFNSIGYEDRARAPFELLNRLMIDKDSLITTERDTMRDQITSSQSILRLLEVFRGNEQLKNGEQKFSFNTEYSHRWNGEKFKRIFQTKVFFMPWDAKDAVVIIMDDITEQHMNLALRVADANKDKMIAMVSHELRTPLNGILGVVQILEKQISETEMLTYLGVCKNSAKLLLNLVNSILDLGQIRNNKLRLNIEKGDIHELLQEIGSLFKFQFSQKGLEFMIEIASDVPKFISTDLNRLRQILINLTGNALKFTFQGAVGIIVKMNANDREYIEFDINDTGIGIKPEDQEKLFKMYGRLDQLNPKTNTDGVGLGLTISEYLARLLANNSALGGIKVKSEAEKGATFSFSIKVDLDDSPDEEEIMSDIEEFEGFSEDDKGRISIPVSAEPGMTERKLSLFGLKKLFRKNSYERSLLAVGSPRPLLCESGVIEKARILIVDDNPFNLMVARRLIQDLGYAVDTAMNGQLAIETIKESILKEKTYRLVLMDIQMPVMNGYEATRLLKVMMKNNEIPEIPIIALSANDTEEDKILCREAGMRDHLPKPLKEESIRKILGNLLDKKATDNTEFHGSNS